MNRFIRIGFVALAVALVSPGARAESVSDLVQKVTTGADFRVRVQAALELGKKQGDTARLALEGALDDANAAVRAAAAAGLKVMKDPTSIAALSRHENDSSSSVRSQIKNALEALRKIEADRKAASKPDVMVQLGKIRSKSSAAGSAVLEDVARASRQKLRALPGIAVLESDKAGAPRKDIPLVMLTGQVKKLEQLREGESVTYMASVEFVLHKMPGQNIRGMFSGSARASGSADEMSDASAMADLRKTAIEAAIESAIRRAPQALRAAVE